MRSASLFSCFFAVALGAAEAMASPRPIPVSNPRAGETVLAGERLSISRSGDFVLPAGARGTIREWEVFLSLDGGRSFPIRLTPHLDTAIWRTTVRIPSYATDQARLLVRFGDERDEHEFEVPGGFRIRADGPPAFEPAFGSTARRGDSGDQPLRGTPRVVAWVERSADGGWREVTSPADSWSAVEVPSLAAREPVELASESNPDGPTAQVARAATLDAPRSAARPTRSAPSTFGRPSDRLSLLRRRNE